MKQSALTLAHTVPRMLRLAALASALWLAPGCDDDDGGAFAWEGVYTITAWTENPTGCDAEGPSVLEAQTETRLVARRNRQSLFGQTFDQIVVGACPDPQECANRTADLDPFGLGAALIGMTVFVERQGEVYESSISSATHDADTNQCSALVSISTLASPVEDQLRLERRTWRDITYPALTGDDGQPTCLDDENTAVRIARESGTCGELRVIVADSPEPVPPAEETSEDVSP